MYIIPKSLFVAVVMACAAFAEEPLETWELDNPRIHNRQIDGVRKRFSVRTVERREGDLYLNGARVEVRAVDWPADADSCGITLTDRVVKRAVIELKGRGYNVLRPAGVPASAVAWCEKIGLLVEDWPTADRIAASEIVRPLPVPVSYRPDRTTEDRVAKLHLSHVHRGGGVAERPDNTLETFLWCWGNGSALECDCRKTADGVGIMLHDDSLARTGRGIPKDFASRSVSGELTWADIADVDVGSYLSPDYASQRIPRMDAVMQAMAGHPKWLLFVDEKGAGPATIAASARQAGVAGQVYYTGSSVANAVQWMKEVPGGKTLVWIGGWPWNHSKAEVARVEAHFRKIRDEIAAAGWAENVSAVSLHTYYDPDYPEPFTPAADFLREMIAEFKAHGIAVCSIPFEGGESAEVYYRLFELGCDGFSSDYPSVMFKVIRDLKDLAEPAGRAATLTVGCVNCGEYEYTDGKTAKETYAANWERLFAGHPADVWFKEDTVKSRDPNLCLEAVATRPHHSSDRFAAASPVDMLSNDIVKLVGKCPEGATRRRYARRLVYEIAGRRIALYGLHLVAEGHVSKKKGADGKSPSQRLRQQQFAGLLDDAKAFDGAVFAGDFNAQEPWEYDIFKEAGYACANCSERFGVTATLRNIPADNIIVSPGLAIETFEVVKEPKLNTDHFPLVSRLTVRQKMRHVLVRDFRTVKDGQCVNYNIGTAAHGPSTVAQVKKYLPGTKVTVWADRPLSDELAAMMRRRFPDVPIVWGEYGPDASPELKSAVALADALLVGSSSGLSASVRASMSAFRQTTGRSVGCAAMGSADPAYRDCAFGWFRDELVLATAEKRGDVAPIHGYAPDSVFDFDCTDEAAAEAFLRENGLERGRFVCAIPGNRKTPRWEFFGGKPDKKGLALNAATEEPDNAVLRAAIVEVVRRHGLKVLVCAEQEPEVALGKRLILDKLPEDVRKRCVWTGRYWAPDLALSVYKASRLVVGIEMHSQVMALGNGVPAVVLSHPGFGTKADMWRTIGCGDWLVDLTDGEATTKTVRAVTGILADRVAAQAKVAAARAFVDRMSAAAYHRSFAGLLGVNEL